MAVASGFEADAIHCAVHLRNFEDLGNLIADRGILGDIDGLAPKTPGLRQPLGDEVAYNHDRGPVMIYSIRMHLALGLKPWLRQ